MPHQWTYREIIPFLALAKNMRGIIYIEPEGTNDTRFIDLMARYHRYRMVGYDGKVELTKDVKKHLKKRCFVPLDTRPFIHFDNLNSIERAIAMAGLYIAPIIATCNSTNSFQEHSIFRITGSKPWDIREFLRHIRISEYTMIDSAIDSSHNDVMEEDLRAIITNDIKKRYWRVFEDGGEHHLGDVCMLKTPTETYIGPVIVLYGSYDDLKAISS